jgi:hypothetical protein
MFRGDFLHQRLCRFRKGHGEIVDTATIVAAHNFAVRIRNLFASVCMKPVVKIKTATNLLAEQQ